VALRYTCIENVQYKIIKIRTGWYYVGYLYYSANPNMATQNLRLGRMLDIAGLELSVDHLYQRQLRVCIATDATPGVNNV